MANKGALGVGIFFLLIGVVGFLMPNSVWNEDSRGTPLAEMTIPEFHDLCSSGLGQLAKLFNEDLQEPCLQAKIVTYGIYGIGIVGIILIIVGAVVPGNPKVMSKMNCWRCGAALDSKTKFCRKCGSSL